MNHLFPNTTIHLKRMKRIALIFSLLLLSGSPVRADRGIDKGLASINRATAEAHVRFLASDELKGREAGWPGGRIAGNYILAHLEALGIRPFLDDYVQPFDACHAERQLRGKRWEVHPDSIAQLRKGVHETLHLRNILGMIPGKRTDEIVIVGAHYDHIGYDPMLEGDQIYNGADDNASGVSAVLQIARAFVASGQQPERTVVFAFWDGEEKGLLGSRAFAQTYPHMDRVKAYLNFDMIGRNHSEAQPQHVVYFYTESHPVFEQWLRDAIATYGLQLTPDYRAWDRPVGGSDNGTFALLDIPIIWYHTDGHPDYHQPGDHADRINWGKVADITKAAFLNAWNLANEKTF